MVTRARFYVYAYYDPRKSSIEPFYVGKGCGNRSLQQLKDANRISRDLTRERIREIRRCAAANPFFIGIPQKEHVWKYLKEQRANWGVNMLRVRRILAIRQETGRDPVIKFLREGMTEPQATVLERRTRRQANEPGGSIRSLVLKIRISALGKATPGKPAVALRG